MGVEYVEYMSYTLYHCIGYHLYIEQMQIECPHISNPQCWTKSLQNRQIYKDQCVRCFHSARDEGGLFACLRCFNSFCIHHCNQHFAHHAHPLFLHMVETPSKTQTKPPILDKIAIGVEGGAPLQIQYDKHHTLFCRGCNSESLSNAAVLQGTVQSLLNADSAFKKQALVSWELQIHPCEHTLTLQQELRNKDLSKCVECDLSINLWLCLTCGNVGCGRKNWDGTGGNNHGIAHFQSHKHPVVVKLGTITAEGDASVYCYICNNDVKDEQLATHFIALGLNITTQKKTQRTIAELSLELNLNFSLSKLLEHPHDKTLYGGYCTGINNIGTLCIIQVLYVQYRYQISYIGNSCYMNAVLQSLNALPQTVEEYHTKGIPHLQACQRIPSNCFQCQVSKVFKGLNSGQYAEKRVRRTILNQVQTEQQYQQGITPYDFKLLMAQKHPQFTSSRQQDALEYLQHVLSRLQKENSPIPRTFDYSTVNVLTCMQCLGHKTVTSKTNEWKIPVPAPTPQQVEEYSMKNKKDRTAEDPQYEVSLQTCLALLQPSVVSARCSQCNCECVFSSEHYFATTPKHLMVVPNRFVVEKWVPRKLNALIHGMESVDVLPFCLSQHRDKVSGPEIKAEEAKTYKEEDLAMLMAMGYGEGIAKRALAASAGDLETAAMWVMEHMDDVEEPKKGGNYNTANIVAMGFTEEQASIAMAKEGDQERAVDWLMMVGGDVEGFKHLLGKGIEVETPTQTKYKLRAVVVHLGKSVHCGHYVAYVRRGHQWVLYNDEKVISQEEPALTKGYIYIYEAV